MLLRSQASSVAMAVRTSSSAAAGAAAVWGTGERCEGLWLWWWCGASRAVGVEKEEEEKEEQVEGNERGARAGVGMHAEVLVDVDVDADGAEEDEDDDDDDEGRHVVRESGTCMSSSPCGVPWPLKVHRERSRVASGVPTASCVAPRPGGRGGWCRCGGKADAAAQDGAWRVSTGSSSILTSEHAGAVSVIARQEEADLPIEDGVPDATWTEGRRVESRFPAVPVVPARP